MTREMQSTRRRYLLGLGASAAAAGFGLGSGVASAAVDSGQQWPQLGYDAANTGFAPENEGSVFDVSQKWRFDPNGNGGSSPVVVGDTVFAALNDSVYAVSDAEGEERWHQRWRRNISSTPAVYDGELYVGAETKIYARDVQNGAYVWDVDTGARVDAAPTVTEELVIIGSHDGYLYAIDRENGMERWSQYTERAQPVTAAVAVDAECTYVGNEGGAVQCFTLDGGSEQWLYECDSAVTSAPSVQNGIVYVGDDSGRVHAIDSSSGERQWLFDTGSETASSVAISGGVCYLGASDGMVYALSAVEGVEQWSYETGGPARSPSVVGSTVYIGSTDGNVYALSASEGSVRWQFDTGSAVESAPAIVNGTVYVRSSGQGLLALELMIDAAIDFEPAKPSTTEPVVFDASGSSPISQIVSFEWSIDGQTLTGETVEYTFSEIRNENVTLTISDRFGHTDTVTVRVPVRGQPPQAEFSYEPGNPRPGDTVVISAAGSTDPDGSITSYEWVVGSTVDSGEAIERTFDEPGNYYVKLTVEDDDGKRSSKTGQIVVDESATPTPTPPDTETPTPTPTPTGTPLTTETTTTAPPGSGGNDLGRSGGESAGGGDSTDEWLQIGAGGLASLVGLAGWLHFDVTGSDEPATTADGTPRAADGSGIESSGEVEDDTESEESVESDASSSADEGQADAEAADGDQDASDDESA